MSKKFKGKVCVYCATAKSTTADHVFPRQLFLERHRAYLPKVPACAPCNAEKSRIENYLLAILPFGGRHESARENLELQVPKRLWTNKKLATALVKGLDSRWSNYGDLITPTMTLPVDSDQFTRFIQLVVRGLVCHHWKQVLSDADSIEVSSFNALGKEFFDSLSVSLKACAPVDADLGEGTVVYRGAQERDHPQVTVWTIEMFGFRVAAHTGSNTSAET